MANVQSPPASVTMSLDPKAIEDMLQQTIQIQIANVLAGKGPALINSIVEQTIKQTVDSEGRPSNSSYNTQPFITWIANKVIRDGVKEAVIAWQEENKDRIKQAFVAQMKKNPSKILEQLADGAISTFAKQSYYSMRIECVTKD